MLSTNPGSSSGSSRTGADSKPRWRERYASAGLTLALLLVARFVPLPATVAAQPLPAVLPLADLDGTNGVSIPGLRVFDLAGYWVRGVGDVDGDGLDDLVVTAPQGGANLEGEAYLFLGPGRRPAALDIGDLDGSNGAVLRGEAFGDSAGVSIAAAGDFNGDGRGDLVVGAPFASPDGRIAAGRAYVVFGRALFPPVVALGELGAGGVWLDGPGLFDYAALSVSGGGDVNGDGLGDVVVSAHRHDGAAPNTGAAFIVYGTATPPAQIDLGSLDGSNGVTIAGVAAEDEAGFSVAHAGDVNGDGFDDVLVGARRADPGGRAKAGEAYLVYGGEALPATIDAAGLDGTNGITLLGIDEKDEAGFAVTSAGDVDGDGFDDLAISAPGAWPDFVFVAGETYLVYGGDSLPGTLELGDIDGTRFDGIDPRDKSGECLAGVGDIDNDGLDDLLIGASLADAGGLAAAGEAYLVLGDPALGSAVALEDVGGAVGGTRIEGAAMDDLAGFGCGAAGDFDGDGIDDLLVGAPTSSTDGRPTGAGYLIYGQARVGFEMVGECPGDVTAIATGLTADGAAILATGPALGAGVVPGGPCAGEEIDLAAPRIGAVLSADGSGAVSFTRTLPSTSCGRRAQIFDLTTCAKSGVATIPRPAQGSSGRSHSPPLVPILSEP